MVMSAKTEFWIAVIGLSGRENGESFQGPGKSCLCDRFMFPDKPPSCGHTSIISQQDFHGPIVNTDHFLYWGRTRRTVDGKVVEFNIIEQTEFLDDVTFSPFNARDPYIKRATSNTINSSRKIQYLSPEQLQDPKSQKAQKFTSRKLHIDGFLCVYDVSKVNDRQAGTQYKFVFELLDLIDVPVVLVATKCDKGRSRHFEEMMYLAKVQKVPIVETSALENVNVAQAFFSLVRIFNRQVIVSKKHITYFNPKDLAKARKSKKMRKAEKKSRKHIIKENNGISEDKKIDRNGSVASKTGSEMSGDWPSGEVLVRSNPEPGSLFPTPRDSPLTDSLLSDPPFEPPYEHINGDDPSPDHPGTAALYENCLQEFDSQEGRTFSSHESSRISSHGSSRGGSGSRCDSAGSRSAGQQSHDTGSRDSQLSKSDSLQSKTSSDEYIPVPRAPYDNYENVRYQHRPCTNQIACPSPTSHSSDSERGFLTGVPDHMKSFQSQRPWEVSYYTNVVIEPPHSAQSDPGTSSGTRSTSSIDTDCQANINYGRQLNSTARDRPRLPPPSLGSISSNGQCDGVSSETSTEQQPLLAVEPPAYANIVLVEECQVTQVFSPEVESHDVPEESHDVPNESNDVPERSHDLLEESHDLLEESHDLHEESHDLPEDEVDSLYDDQELPPYPEISFTSGDGTNAYGELSRDLEEMNTLVGEISSLVWQNEPLPPPPSDYLTPATISDFEKTPTNELASPGLLNRTEVDSDGFNFPTDNVARDSNEDCYENTQLPELPPRQPVLPPRGDNLSSRDSSSSSRDVSSTRDVKSSRDLLPVPLRPELPHRIPLAQAGRDTFEKPFIPPRDKSRDPPSRTATLPMPSRNAALPSRDTSLQSRDLTLPPRTIPLPPRDSLTQPRNASSTAMSRGEHSQTLPTRSQHRSSISTKAPPQRIPGPAFHHPAAIVTENGAVPPNLPPRIKADSSQSNNVRHEPSVATPHMPTRVPLPSGPVYTEVEKKGNFPRVIHQHEFSPYVVPSAPRIDRWEEYTSNCIDKKSQTLKKKVKVKIPQR